MECYHPSTQTTVFVLIFCIATLALFIKNTVRNTIDLYDFILLSMIIVGPMVVVFAPRLTSSITRMLGVTYPFVVLFGFLFFVIFVTLYRLIVRIHKYKKTFVTTLHELSLLRKKIDELDRNRPQE